MREIEKRVREIIERVRKEGDKALIFYTKKFDGISLLPADLKVNRREIERAFREVGSDFIELIEKAKDNVEEFHLYEYNEISGRNGRKIPSRAKGISFVELWRPLEKIGVYVPGGRYTYPSSLLMTVVPAKVAGVERIVVCSPPGKLSSEVLATAKICGVEEIYRVGGVQAIAGLAYGTETIPRVDKIFGPGNVYVATAKRLLFGEVGIDMVAGPSEVLVIADETADPDYIACDLMAQLEHGEDTVACLIATSPKVRKLVERKIKTRRLKLIEVEDIKEAVRLANEFSPEHLEIMVKKPESLLPALRNVGEVFLGKWSPVALGDYYAGPSHVLPTGRSARFSSGLSVKDFLKRIVAIKCSRKGLEDCAKEIIDFARVEGLAAHARSIEIRLSSSDFSGGSE